MQSIIRAFIYGLLIITTLSGCGTTAEDWMDLLPEDVTAIIVPAPNVQSSSLLNKEYVSILDDITPSAIQQISNITETKGNGLELTGITLLPVTSTSSDLLWIFTDQEQDLSEWADLFYQPFSQNTYYYKGFTIHKLFLNNNITFAAQIDSWLLLSPSSLAIEQSIRTALDEYPAVKLSEIPAPGSLIINTPKLDVWSEQLAEVLYRPSLTNAFKGTDPVAFRSVPRLDTLGRIHLHGELGFSPDSTSELIAALSTVNKPVILDRYIAGNAAAFALFRKKPFPAPPSGITNPTQLDSLLLNNATLYREMATTLGDEFALEVFPESGFNSSGEYLYMRKIENVSTFRNLINRLKRDGLITSDGLVNSTVLGRMIGSELCDFRDFYLDITNEVVVIARRLGLAESVSADRNRRRVMYYDDTYSAARDQIPEEVSGFAWIRSAEFLQFLRPYLKSNNVAGGLINQFDVLSISMQTDSSKVITDIRSFKTEGSDLPYEELWVLPLSNTKITGTPVLSNLVGSSTEEIIFATDEGRVIALASDGTIALQTRTGTDVPIGSPIIYDWYRNGQPVIMLAAGQKIYAWNNNGGLLPNFPIEMSSPITAPINVTDVLRNGVPEILVATEDRLLNLLDARGNNVTGWPQQVNTFITEKPEFKLVDDVWSVWAYASNTLHSWLRNGGVRPGFPKFINAPFTGTPVAYKDNILTSAADGYLYSFGLNHTFSDSLSSEISDDSVSVRGLYASNNELFGLGIQENVLLRDSSKFYREDLFSMQSSNGSVLMYNPEGQLRFTASLGQPAASSFSPLIADINSDGDREVIALAEFGRLFAWEVLTGERIYDIPTSGMSFPLLTDLNGDGKIELIAQTREGLRCWTLSGSD